MLNMNTIKNLSHQKWRDKAVKRYEFYVHKTNDAEVYEHLESVENKRQYIINLIKADIKKTHK